jgi:hypothetical protein
MNRREVLFSAPPAVVAGSGLGALATCGPTGIQIDPNVLVAINNAVAQGCNFIPAITTVIALVNAAFPTVIGTTTIAQGVLTEIAGMLCAHAPAVQAGKLGTKTLNAGGTDIPVHGWSVVDGKITYV